MPVRAAIPIGIKTQPANWCSRAYVASLPPTGRHAFAMPRSTTGRNNSKLYQIAEKGGALCSLAPVVSIRFLSYPQPKTNTPTPTNTKDQIAGASTDLPYPNANSCSISRKVVSQVPGYVMLACTARRLWCIAKNTSSAALTKPSRFSCCSYPVKAGSENRAAFKKPIVAPTTVCPLLGATCKWRNINPSTMISSGSGTVLRSRESYEPSDKSSFCPMSASKSAALATLSLAAMSSCAATFGPICSEDAMTLSVSSIVPTVNGACQRV